jgi:hypothetical protein
VRGVQNQTEGFLNILIAVDVLMGALKPLKKDVSPLHYHAGVIWCALSLRRQHMLHEEALHMWASLFQSPTLNKARLHDSSVAINGSRPH